MRKNMPKAWTGAILKEVMRVTGTRQVGLAEKMGILQTAVSGMVNRRQISVNAFVKALNAMGYKLYVGREDGEDIEVHCEVIGNDE